VAAIRQRARLLIDAIVEEELEQALGAAPSVRSRDTRTGYRHIVNFANNTQAVVVASPRASQYVLVANECHGPSTEEQFADLSNE
jgi:hypothetical protein